MAVRAVIAVCCLPQQAEKLLLDEDAPEEGAKPVTLFETVRLIFVSPQMRLSIPIIFYNGLRWARPCALHRGLLWPHV